MRLLARSLDVLDFPIQGEVESAAYEQIFEALELATKLDMIVEEYLSQILVIEPDKTKAQLLARRWAVQSLCDYLAALANLELIFVE